jgi:type I restriction enzyme S subunit
MSFGKPYILDINGCIHDGWLVIRDNSDTFNKSFLYYMLSSPNMYQEFRKLAVGGVVNNLNSSIVRNVVVPIPPMAEQDRIVAELDLLSGIIEKKKEQLKAYDQLAQSIFYTMFGDPIDNPKGWEVKTIGNTCTITCGQDYKTVEDENGKYPIYGTGGIMGWANQFRCPKDSVIIGRKGNINNPILVDVDFWNVDTAFGVTPNNDVLSAIYFFFFCKEYDFTQHDVSVTIPSLRRTDILKIKLPVPPLSLQQEFAEKVEAIERQKALVQQSIEETQTMFDSRMDYFFD